MNEVKKQNKIIREGDSVKVIAGNDRGTTGTVLSRTLDRVTIRGVNVCKKHVKKSEQNPQGGIIQVEKPIHISNVAICVDENEPRKLRVKTDAEGNRSLTYHDGKKEVVYRNIKKQG